MTKDDNTRLAEAFRNQSTLYSIVDHLIDILN